MLISPMLFIVRGPRLLVSHRGGASGAYALPSPDAASLRYARTPTKPHPGNPHSAVTAAFLAACLRLDLIEIQVRTIHLRADDGAIDIGDPAPAARGLDRGC